MSFQKFEGIFLARLWENRHPHTLQILIKNAHPPVDGNQNSKIACSFTFGPVFSPLETYPKDTLGETHKHVLKTNIVRLVIIARDWEQPKGLLSGDKLNKIWCMYTMEYYTTVNKNEKHFHRLLRFGI